VSSPTDSSLQSNTGHQYTKNYSFNFDFGPPWGNCNVVMTHVQGHLTTTEFGPECKSWQFPPPERLFDAPVYTTIDEVCVIPILNHNLESKICCQDKRAIASNITSQARGARALFIWTDCDREGEHIGTEVRTEALKGNRQLEVKRARFSNIERA
jgi:DNA topoisomerase-3